MFKNLFRIHPSYWLLVPPILQATIPWITFRIRITYVFVFVLLWLFVNIDRVVAIVGSYRSRNFRAALIWFLLFSFLQNIYALLGHGDFSQYGHSTLYLSQMVYFAVVHCAIFQKRFPELRFLLLFALGGIVIAGIMAFRSMGIEGLEGARSLTGTGIRQLSLEDEQMIDLTTSFGLGDYRYVYFSAWLAGLMPFAVSLGKNLIFKILCIVVFLACLVSAKMGGLGTPMFIIGLELMIFIVWRISRSRMVIKVLGGVLSIAFMLYATTPVVFSPFSGILKVIGESMSEGSVKARVISVADTFSGDDNTYARERMRLQMASWNVFLDHPIFGEGMYNFDIEKGKKSKTGGHSFVLDRLGTSGILGFLPFLVFLFYLARYYEDLSKWYFGHTWLVMPTMFIPVFFFTSIANPTFGIPHMMYIIFPGFAYLIILSRGGQPKCFVQGQRIEPQF